MPAEVILDLNVATIEAWAAEPGSPVFLHMASVGVRTEELGRKYAPKGATGDLENSVQALPPVVAGGHIEVVVEATAPYAYWVHEGTRPHEIRPKNGTVLAWDGPDGPAFARVVHHPGTKAQPFLRDAVTEAVLE